MSRPDHQVVLVAQWCARRVHESHFDQVGLDPEHVHPGADEAGLAATGVHVERVLAVRVARINAVEVVRELCPVHHDRRGRDRDVGPARQDTARVVSTEDESAPARCRARARAHRPGRRTNRSRPDDSRSAHVVAARATEEGQRQHCHRGRFLRQRHRMLAASSVASAGAGTDPWSLLLVKDSSSTDWLSGDVVGRQSEGRACSGPLSQVGGRPHLNRFYPQLECLVKRSSHNVKALTRPTGATQRMTQRRFRGNHVGDGPILGEVVSAQSASWVPRSKGSVVRFSYVKRLLAVGGVDQFGRRVVGRWRDGRRRYGRVVV